APASGAPSSDCAGWASWPAEPAVPEGGMKGVARDGREADEIRVSLVLATVDRVAEPMRFVESLAEQIERRFELVVVDQNPDNRLGPVLARARAAGIPLQYLRQAVPNLALARNTGIEAARGEWIGFPDDDCWHEPET